MSYETELNIWRKASEIVIALVAPTGVDKTIFIDRFTAQLQEYDYKAVHIRISPLLESDPTSPDLGFSGEYLRIYKLMEAGNAARKEDPAILAKSAICRVLQARKANGIPPKGLAVNKIVYIIDAIKHHAELDLLQNVYGDGFYLIALSTSIKSREAFLIKKKKTLNKDEATAQARKLISRDSDDEFGHGQEVSEFFHRSDYFIGDASNAELVDNSIDRFLKIIFNHPYVTPTFAEYAMHMAYVASTKSADMSRQVGSVIAQGESIIAMGANEVPKSPGGTYWPSISENGFVSDVARGRDYTLGYETNKAEINNIIDCILLELKSLNSDIDSEKIEGMLRAAGITSLTEFGRMLHAEMDSILECSRRGIATKGSTMYVTTFPCHNCAKHIVGSGISEVIFIEPYQKSKALDLHSDSICSLDDDQEAEGSKKVVFRPFVGLGPRYYMALFSLSVSRGKEKSRKAADKVSTKEFVKKKASPRLMMGPTSYMGKELIIAKEIQTES